MGGVACCTARQVDGADVQVDAKEGESAGGGAVGRSGSQEELLDEEWQIVAGDIAPAELDRLAALRDSVQDMDGHPACRARKRHREGQTLLRFLRGRDGNVLQAEKMFRASMDWRDSFQVDEKIACWGQEVAAATSKRSRVLTAFGTDEEICLDKAGVPVWLMRISASDPAGIAREAGKDAMLVNSLAKMESMHAHIRRATFKHRRVIRGCVQVLDVGDYGEFGVPNWWSRMMTYYWAGKDVWKVFEANYPETARRIFIIRMGPVTTKLYRWVEPLVPARTQQKMRICGWRSSEWASGLRSEVEEGARIPLFLTSDCKNALASARPPGGIVPSDCNMSEEEYDSMTRTESVVLRDMLGSEACDDGATADGLGDFRVPMKVAAIREAFKLGGPRRVPVPLLLLLAAAAAGTAHALSMIDTLAAAAAVGGARD